MESEEFNARKETLKQVFVSDTRENEKSNTFLLKERFEIEFNTPIDWLDNNGAKAYKVNDRVNVNNELFVLVCNNDTAPRNSYLSSLKSIDHSNIMKLVEYGVIDYHPEKSKNLALIYQTPVGGRVLDDKETKESFRTNLDKLRMTILKLLGAIESLSSYNCTHRAIRLNNLYFKDTERTEIVLGDCIASFPAFHQNPAYETTESLMCQKEGRGNGSIFDDIYSMGVAGLGLFLGHDPLDGLSTPEVLRQKLKKGSYMALINKDKIPNQLSILLKGLLYDNTKGRWNYIQTYNYLEGKQNIPYQSIAHERPRKSIIINGEKVHTAIDVVYAMRQSFSEAYDLIRSGKMFDWIKNSFDNEEKIKRIEKIIKQDLDSGIEPDVLVSKLSILIDPSLPIAIRDLSLFPDGAPKAIFTALKKKKNTSQFITLFSSDLIKLWYQEQESIRSPANTNEFKIYINRRDIGYGLERIMYDFDEDLPCISPLLGNEYVNSSTKVLKALDNTYASSKINEPPYDNAIISYLRCKMGKKLDPTIFDINSKKEEIRASAILQLYANMQKKYGPANLPNLGTWLISFSKSIIKSYHNKKYQKFLEREILKINKNGKLTEIASILENPESRRKDRNGYTKAQKDVIDLLQEKNHLLNNSFKIDDEAKFTAIRFASIFAALILVASIILNLINLVIKL